MNVAVFGGYCTDFARNWARENLGMLDMLDEAVRGAVEDARVEFSEIEVVHVGNLAAELFCGQAQLGGMVAMLHPELAELPSSRHEGACASGSLAVLAAMADLEAGRYDVALVVGAELMRNVSGEQAANYLGCATWAGHEAEEAKYPWVSLFNQLAEEVDKRYGLDSMHLNRIAEINFGNAKSNVMAQTRDWDLAPGSFGDDSFLNPVVEGRLRKQDCGRITDGAAAVILASPRFAAEHRSRLGGGSRAVVAGWGHRSAPLGLDQKLRRSEGDPYIFPHLVRAVRDAYGRAQIAGPGDIDMIETHDCFTVTEYVALDHLGLTPPGHAWEVIEDGRIEKDGTIPVNPSGVLGVGHPVGATGVRMLVDAARQVEGRAGETQVADVKRAMTLNVGGSFTTVASLVVASDQQ